MKKVLLATVFLLLFSGGLSARGLADAPDTLRTAVRFRQGHSSYDAAFGSNGLHLASLLEQIRSMRRDSTGSIVGLRIIAGASPEGNTDLQKVLSDRRGEQVVDLLERYDFFYAYPCEVVSLGIDWDGLTQLVAASDMPSRSEVLRILRYTPEWIKQDGIVVDGRKRQLQMLHGGRTWHYMEKYFFPVLRRARIDVLYYDNGAAYDDGTAHSRSGAFSGAPADTVVMVQRDTVVMVQRDTVTVTAPRREYPFCMALRTNLLYDAALVPNVGAEFYVGRGWSLGVDGMYGWWSNDDKHRYWRIYGGELAVRKYFGRRAAVQPLTGHHLGLYGQALTYDFETGDKGVMGGAPGGTLLDKAHWGVGLEYGYSAALGRRLNLDFSLGIGYIGGEYMEYRPLDTHYVWQTTRQRHWFGPTKAEIALVWRLGPGALKEKKGGKR